MAASVLAERGRLLRLPSIPRRRSTSRRDRRTRFRPVITCARRHDRGRHNAVNDRSYGNMACISRATAPTRRRFGYEVHAGNIASMSRRAPSPLPLHGWGEASSATCMPGRTRWWSFLRKPKGDRSLAARLEPPFLSWRRGSIRNSWWERPCSWGTLEFAERRRTDRHGRMLDDLRNRLHRSELGDWASCLMNLSSSRRIDNAAVLVGAFVPLPEGPVCARRRHRKTRAHGTPLPAVASSPPLLCSPTTTAPCPSDIERRAHHARSRLPGRMMTSLRPSRSPVVRDETGLRTVFHITARVTSRRPPEIDTLSISRRRHSGPGLDNWALHVRLRRRSVVEALDATATHLDIHLKDCHPAVPAQAAPNWGDYFEALRHGVFCELGKGAVIPRQAAPAGRPRLPGLHAGRTGLCPHGSPQGQRRRTSRVPHSIEHNFSPSTNGAHCEPEKADPRHHRAGRIGKVHAESSPSSSRTEVCGHQI